MECNAPILLQVPQGQKGGSPLTEPGTGTGDTDGGVQRLPASGAFVLPDVKLGIDLVISTGEDKAGMESPDFQRFIRAVSKTVFAGENTKGIGCVLAAKLISIRFVKNCVFFPGDIIGNFPEGTEPTEEILYIVAALKEAFCEHDVSLLECK